MTKIIFTLSILLYTSFSLADSFSALATYKVCFTPAEPCTDLIVAEIENAKKQILVQAYSFTSVPIARALTKANKRGVEVKVILDKSQFRSHGFSSAKFFSDYHIPVLVDYKPAIAHNKVMIIDHKTVITGSFNFTKAAEERNAENVIIISDEVLAKKYASNWCDRADESKVVRCGPSPFE